MGNPLAIAAKGKGVFPMLSRAGTIATRYGLTPGKMDHALAQLARVLQEFNCQATLPVTASALSHNPLLAQKVRAQGLELAVHGLTHIDYTQLSVDQQCDHFRRALWIFDKAGFSPTGFRSPYLRWNADTLRALLECGFDYDSSQALAWDADGSRGNEAYARALQFYGAQFASQYPSLPRLEGQLVRIPYCLPDDEALVERLKLPPGPGMSEVWLGMLGTIYEAGELFTLGIHPERVHLCKDALWAVLARARSLSPSVWIARLDEIAAWYRGLGKASFTTEVLIDGGIRLNLRIPDKAILLSRYVEVDAPTKAWSQGYQQVLTSEFSIRGERRPWIGLPPDTPPGLPGFLMHLGYLVEISTDPHAFSYYYPQRSFRPEDERPLLAELEIGNRPLLRLGRWPDGAQAALAVTGDVDAFTLWDYGLRVWNR